MELVELKNWWLNNQNVWFNSTESDDIEITNKFEHLIDIQFNTTQLIDNIDQGIGYIILHDQIVRHIKRVKNYPDEFILNKLDNIISFVEQLYLKYKNHLSGYDFCFVLLPLRHTNLFEKQVYVIQETWNKITCFVHDTSNPNEQKLLLIYKNYLKASYERTSSGKVYLTSNQIGWKIQEKIEEFVNKFKDIFDPTCHNYKSNLNYLTLDNLNPIIKACEKLKHTNIKNIILSISGGIDSICLSYIYMILGIEFVMVHINYSNRGEICEKEKEMLKYWAGYIGIELYIRDIEEISRPKCMEWDMRSLYESYTHDVRYQSYIDVLCIKGWNLTNSGIMLGHNHDDCIENILTNIISKTKYENLYGMEFKTNIKFKFYDICFIRPILTITKSQIYDFAHQYNIPYLSDSTPKWSQRGQIRDIIRPNLINWNKSSINGLDELSKIMKSSMECVDMLVDNWIEKMYLELNDKDIVSQIKKLLTNTITINSLRFLKINIDELKPNKIFWSRLLAKLKFNINSRILDDLLNKIKIIKKQFLIIQPKQKTQIKFTQKNIIYYWKTLDNYLIFSFVKMI